MNDIAVEIRPVEARRVASIARTAPSVPEVGPIVGPLFPEVAGALGHAGVLPHHFGPGIADYAMRADGSVGIRAGFVVPDSIEAVPGVDVEVWPAYGEVAVTVHHGDMDTIGDSWGALMAWTAANGYEMIAPGRELYLTEGDVPMSEWDTELQQPVRKASA
ncbi:MAG: GyrI-like domain-containing protein [Microbacteriaceae bacterium]|nr:GyrI-like domain-containing protein [Microbacteriaceae bacterium]MCL2794079.1 GyrI-like domain-containing protein [Microbacteriaceae bacterium]